jgi:Spy/CpxP family protein refolding chaperone
VPGRPRGIPNRCGRSPLDIMKTARLRADARGRDGGVRQVMATRMKLTDEQRDKIKDIVRLLASEEERQVFLEMLERELRGRELADSDELRRVAEQTWRKFLWP